MSLDECKGVSDFAEKLREARTELLELDATCEIGEPQFVNKFLTGLGSNFDVFLTSFYQTHSLIPKRDEKIEVVEKAATFEEAVMAAEKEEQSQKTGKRRPPTWYMAGATEEGPQKYQVGALIAKNASTRGRRVLISTPT